MQVKLLIVLSSFWPGFIIKETQVRLTGKIGYNMVTVN